MLLRFKFFCQIGLLVYVAVWAYFRLRPYWLLRKQWRPSVYEIEKLSRICDLIMTYGWFFVLFFPVSCVLIFPEVRIITQDVHRAKAECWYGYDNISDRKTFFVDRYYVPFRYKGAKYMPGKSYLINGTDSTLVLYPVYFYNGLYSDKNISRHEAMAVRPHSSNQWSKGIDNHFYTPHEHFFIPEKQKGEELVEWTIDTEAGAAEGWKKIENTIAERNAMMNKLMESGWKQ